MNFEELAVEMNKLQDDNPGVDVQKLPLFDMSIDGLKDIEMSTDYITDEPFIIMVSYSTLQEEHEENIGKMRGE